MKRKKMRQEVRELIYDYRPKRRVVLGIIIVLIVLLYAFKNAFPLIRILSTIGLVGGFYVADHLFDLRFKKRHYAFVIMIAVSSFLLSSWYFIYPNYDKVLHLVQPALFGSIVFYMISKLDLKLKWKLTFVFFVIVGVLGLHEIGEYLLDYFFNLNLQGVFLRGLQGLEKFDILMDRLDDTMIDMSLGVISAVVYVFGVWFLKRK